MDKRQTKKDKSDWFDSHVIIMGPNADFEDKMREALKKKVCETNQKRKDNERKRSLIRLTESIYRKSVKERGKNET